MRLLLDEMFSAAIAIGLRKRNIDAVAVQERPEHTRGIGSGQAQPFDRPVRRDQAALLAIRQESIISNRRERAHRYLTSRGRERNVRRFGPLSSSVCASVPPLAPPPMTMRSQRSVT